MYSILKPLFDIVFSLIGLILFLPLILIIACLIKLDSQGPVFYRGERAGRYGKIFRIFKFRTMIVNADQIGASSTPDDDPRITKIGRLLRQFKLDELPQLINVLRGEMSFVGPRPQVPWIVELDKENYDVVLSVKPGIADYAFVILPNEADVLKGSKDPDGDYLRILHPEKMKLSREYVKKQSFWLDMMILIDTAMLSFFRRNIFLHRLTVDEIKNG